MPPAEPVPFSTWLTSLHPLQVYASCVAAIFLAIALAQALASFRVERRALRLFALRYAAGALGWQFAHPQAYADVGRAPFVPMVVAVGLIALTLWALCEFLGTATRRALYAIGAAAALAVAGLWAYARVEPDSAQAIYFVMGAGMAYCAALAWNAARREPGVGHRVVAAAFASYPALMLLIAPFDQLRSTIDMAYLVAVPGVVVGITVLVVSLMRAELRMQRELQRRRAAERELRESNASLEQRVAERTGELQVMVDGLESFARSVSHDLRGSLAGISGVLRFAEEAAAAGDLDRVRRLLSPAVRQSEQLAGLVQALLELSRSGQATLARRRQSADAAVKAALEQLALDPEAARLLERVPVDVEPLAEVDADDRLLRQVFVNLLGNALRFAGTAAQPRVRVGRRASDGALFVADNGPGFPAERAGELFKPFKALHEAGLSRHGLGLSIVRRIVERHGGRVWAESAAAPQTGATFCFTLGSVSP